MGSRFFAVGFAVVLAGCQCGGPRLHGVPTCDDGLDCSVPDAGPVVVEMPPPPDCPAAGRITGRVCATDQRTFVNGAAVQLDATNCHGALVKVEAVSGADGSFALEGVPPGSWLVHASTGSFQQDTKVTVASGASLAIPDNQLCVEQKEVKIAVITGPGDKIEDLLTSLKLTFTTYDGSSSGYATSAAVFLADLTQLKKYDIVFVDCASARSGGSIDLGPKAAKIEENLAAYVEAGGSIYASDWALLFAVAAHPGAFEFLTTGAGVANPMPTNSLLGYAPQTLTAKISDPGLATFLNKSTVQITFPKAGGASSLHWGLMQNVSGNSTVLVSAVTAQTCSTSACSAAGMAAMGIPLAARVKVTPADQRGGQVLYTSFHNIGQPGDDVAQILKYLILHL